MKNIHLIPTEPNDETSGGIWIEKTRDWCNIYITNLEEIKEGDSIFETDTNTINVIGKDYVENEFDFKIILTDNKELIKDGVQAIDDEFFSWFVENPSCEWVEIANDLKYFNVDELRERHLKGLPHLYSESIGYKIIIPKEEPKQKCEHCKQFISKYGCACGGQIKEPKKRLEKYSERFDNKDNELVKGVFNPENWGKRLVKDKPKQDRTCTNNCSVVCGECQIFEPKQETLEEASYNYAKDKINRTSHLIGFREGAKWQQEQDKNKYNEEEVKGAFKIGFDIGYGSSVSELDLKQEYCNKWFEQFKKK